MSEEVKKHTRIYIRVFIALALLTIATVAVAYLRLPIVAAVLVALSIATLKGGLVAGFFMHLVSEKKIIYWILICAAFFFLVLLLVPVISKSGV